MPFSSAVAFFLDSWEEYCYCRAIVEISNLSRSWWPKQIEALYQQTWGSCGRASPGWSGIPMWLPEALAVGIYFPIFFHLLHHGLRIFSNTFINIGKPLDYKEKFPQAVWMPRCSEYSERQSPTRPGKGHRLLKVLSSSPPQFPWGTTHTSNSNSVSPCQFFSPSMGWGGQRGKAY